MKVTDLRRQLMAALAAGGLIAPGALHAANLNTNLVVNGTFENVDLATTSDYNAPLILDWGGAVQGFAYSHNGSSSNGGVVPDYAVGAPLANGANWYFTPGNNGNNSLANAITQSIDVSTGPTATAIASGAAAFRLSGFFNTFSTQLDRGVLHVDFRNSANTSLGTGMLTPSVPPALTGWTELTTGGGIPLGTQTVLLSAYGIAATGSPDGYMDNLDFQVTTILPALSITVSRDTGAITLSNQTGSAENISAYVVTSAFEGLNPANWRSIAENYDAGNPGASQVDAANDWSELTDSLAHGDLSEAELETGNGTSLANNRTINLGNANTWIKTPEEDLTFQYISGGQIVQGIVSYSGNGGVPFAFGDLNVDGDITAADWVILRTNQFGDLSELSLAEAYRLGDLDGDGQNNYPDFVAFKSAFDAANGAGSFVAMLAGGVPEPSTVVFLFSAGLFVLPFARRAARHD